MRCSAPAYRARRAAPCPRAFDHRAPATHEPYTRCVIEHADRHAGGPLRRRARGRARDPAQAITGLSELAELAGLTPVHVPMSASSPTCWRAPASLALFTIGETPWSTEQKMPCTRRGATATSRSRHALGHGRQPHLARVRGHAGRPFDGHPGPSSSPLTWSTTAPGHGPPGRAMGWTDEVYLFAELRPDAGVLLRLAEDQVDLSAPGGRVPDCGFPLAWCIEDGPAAASTPPLGTSPWLGAPRLPAPLAGGLAWLEASA